MICIMGCHKYSQVAVLFSASLSLKICSSQGIFCEYMIRGTTAPVFNLTLALKNVTDSNRPTPYSSPSTLTTAGYRDRPIRTTVEDQVSCCLEGNGFLYFVVCKKQNTHVHKSLSRPFDPLLECRFINWTATTNQKLSLLRPSDDLQAGQLRSLPCFRFHLRV